MHLHWLITYVFLGPLAPIMAIWGAIQINFKEKPALPLPVPAEILQKAQQEINLNISLFYNVAVVGCSGTGKVCFRFKMKQEKDYLINKGEN